MAVKKKRQSIVEQVIRSLLDNIAQGELSLGERILTEPELAEKYKVSRSSIREAIRVLEILNVVEVRHGTGTYIKTIRPSFFVDPAHIGYSAIESDILSLMELRKIIEPESAALAAKRASEEELQTLKKDVEALRKGVEEKRRPFEDLGFHLDIAYATHNQSIINVSQWIVAFYQIDPEVPDNIDVSGHTHTLEAICNRNPEAARTSMHEHLSAIEKRLMIVKSNS
jgi:GntR family transcriptional regulator, transcriptional repressor for pyruvate dehydrogenase complex